MPADLSAIADLGLPSLKRFKVGERANEYREPPHDHVESGPRFSPKGIETRGSLGYPTQGPGGGFCALGNDAGVSQRPSSVTRSVSVSRRNWRMATRRAATAAA